MNDIVKEFLVESYDNLDRLDRDFIELEKGGDHKDLLSSIFRTIHTIKGTCGFLGFGKLESLAHIAENLLAKLRDGALPVTREIIDSLLSAVDGVRAMLSSIEETENDGENDYAEVKESLTRLLNPDWKPAPAKRKAVKKEPEGKKEKPPEFTAPPDEGDADREGESVPAFGALLLDEGKVNAGQIDQALKQQAQGDPRRVGEILVEQGAIQSSDVSLALKKQEEQKASAVSDSSIRVDVALLDKLMNRVGELVLERNRLLQFTQEGDAAMNACIQRLNRITTELQEGVMKTRMQPVGNIWNKFPRVVRDLSQACGKRIRLTLDGKETELDRTLLEAIKDPLTHLVRNSIDHGVETPEARRAAGKDEEGEVSLRAFHEGGQVIMEIIDDGGGIDPQKIKRKSVEKGLIQAGEAEKMSDHDALQLIFLPGFSTAEKVTNVSGRGVGMDVVKTNIEKIGGQVDIASHVGKGTTFRLKIPLTLAIVPALIVKAAGDRFAIPQVALRELLRVEKGQGIETIQGRRSLRLRGHLLPLLDLNQELGFPVNTDPKANFKVVVLHADGKTWGLVVEEILDTEEIVVKPLGQQLKGLEIFAGATIMGDGKIALILDTSGLARRGQFGANDDQADLGRVKKSSGPSQAMTSLLLLKTPRDGRMVVPLSQVARLEEFKRDSLERAGNLNVVRYRDEIMPVLPVMEWLPEYRGDRKAGDFVDLGHLPPLLNVVVYSWHGENIGLLVDDILDILDHPFEIQSTAARDGILGTIAVHDKVTEVLDLERIIQLGEPHFFTRATSQPTGA